MTVNEKLLQFLDHLAISQRKFTGLCGLSEGALRGSKSVGVESLAKIKLKYPELSLAWIMFNKGPMLMEEGLRNKDDYKNEMHNSLDSLVDQRIDMKLEDFKLLLTEFIRADINKELGETLSLKKNDPLIK